MDGTRREFTKALVALLAFPASAIAATMRLADACIQMGKHWSLPKRFDWRKASERQIREHLIATHGHARDRAKLQRLTWSELLELHDTHHQAGGGRFHKKGIDVTIPDYPAGSVIHPWN